MKNKFKHMEFIVLSLIILSFVVVAVSASHIATHAPNLVDLSVSLMKPCKEYPFGTDSMGRCILCRILYGTRPSLISAFIVIAIIFSVGSLLGIISAYFGGIVDIVIMRINVIFQAFPSFILCICIAGVLSAGLKSGIIALCIISWTHYTRMSRSLTLEMFQNDYIKSAKISGASDFYIMIRHILPNIISPLIVMAALDIGGVILNMASLSFLGLGAQRPSSEWGLMMSDNRQYLQTAPWTVVFPGIALLVLVIVFNLLADNIRDNLDKKYIK